MTHSCLRTHARTYAFYLQLFLFVPTDSSIFDHACLALKAELGLSTLERADFTLQLLMFVTVEKERDMFIIFFLSCFCQLLSLGFEARTG